MSKKLTPWFPSGVKPLYVGIYRVDPGWDWIADRECYSYWDGSCFNWISDDASHAADMRKDRGAGGGVKFWRGLAKKP